MAQRGRKKSETKNIKGMDISFVSPILDSFNPSEQRFTVPTSAGGEESNEAKAQQLVVELNVGGHYFCTSLATLLLRPDSYFVDIFKRKPELASSTKPIFIDRDGTYFRYILNFLRGCSDLPGDKQFLREILAEANFYQLSTLEESIKNKLSSQSTITQNQLENGILKAVKGVVNAPVHLDFKDLRGILFKDLVFNETIDFERSNLSDAVFQNCKFKKQAKFEFCDMAKTRFEKCDGLLNSSFIGSKICGEHSFEPEILKKLREARLI
ncbi:hypothetical protein LOD99_14396 [Oopsacas minuta]|uniref:BTB domain-containing protein n=1 Tax=Oopsacas minuta TaxID=111878 RepID=A0AAV7KH89_9METZ|nr:hypothetical protein LOD99_14396 [Oopsacas minuta]